MLAYHFNRLRGALRSMHPAAYLGVGIKAAAPFTRLIDHAVYKIKISKNVSKIDLSKIHSIFIVCAPRSGGTLVYQALSRTLPGIYISNFHALFPRLGSRILRKAKWQSKQTEFNNYYGYTSSLRDVYEGNEFYKWAHRKYADGAKGQPNSYYRDQFQNMINDLEPRPNECVIFKNARSYFMIKYLHAAIPELKFIRVKRSRDQVIESVLRAYHDLGSFHPIPYNLKTRKIVDPLEFAVAQIEEIESTIDRHLEGLPASAQFVVEYEKFCENAQYHIDTIAYDFIKLPAGSVSECSALSQLKSSSREKVTAAERRKIDNLINESRKL